MRAYLPASVVFAASIINSAAVDIILLRGLQHTYHNGHEHEHSLRVLSTADAVTVPSAAPSIHPSVEKALSSSSVPTALSESILDPSDNDVLSMSAATASDSATMSDSSTIHDNSQQLEEEQESGLFGMSLFQTCAAVILIGMILGLFGHYGMKLLPYNRHNRLREDNARNHVQSEDSLASFRPHPNTSVLNVGV